MDFYHGTTVGGFTELLPFANPGSNLQKACVYLTTSKQLAAHYIMDKGRIGSCPMLDIRKDGVLVFQEMFSDALAYMYKGLSGYIYHCKGGYPLNAEAGVRFCATSEEPVPVMGVEYVADVYEHIVEYGRYGGFIYERYEELPRWRHSVIRGIVMRHIKECGLLANANTPEAGFYQSKYPGYWQEAEVLHRHGLL